MKNIFIEIDNKIQKGTFGAHKYLKFKDSFKLDNPPIINTSILQTEDAGEELGSIREGFICKTQEERLDLSPLLEVDLPLDDSIRSVLDGEQLISLNLALWKLAHKVPKTEKRKEEDITRITISQWNA